MSILRTENIKMQFGGVVAVNDFSIEIEENKIVALIGPNGAGKTTAFNVITGVYKPTAGNVFFSPDGNSKVDITGKLPDNITKMGMARTFQNIRLFKSMTVFDNVLVAKHLHLPLGFIRASLPIPQKFRVERKMREEALMLLEKLGLTSVKDELATSLPYGLQRRLEIARALATNPRILLLDEPAAGMNPQETYELTQFIRQIKDEFNLTVFMIEHHMDLVMEISDKIYVLDFGQTIAKGTAAEIQNNPKVIEAYLGVQADA